MRSPRPEGDDGSDPRLVHDSRRTRVTLPCLTLTCGDAPQAVIFALPTPTERSLIELTKIRRGRRHLSGAPRAWGWTVTPNPGPLVRGSPSVW
jgi:hypothetical protein